MGKNKKTKNLINNNAKQINTPIRSSHALPHDIGNAHSERRSPKHYAVWRDRSRAHH